MSTLLPFARTPAARSARIRARRDISSIAQKFYIPGVDDQVVIENQRRQAKIKQKAYEMGEYKLLLH